MPELPDVVLYLEALAPRVLGQPLERVRLASPFLLRSVAPPISSAEGKRVVALRRLGKRLVFALEGDLFLVLHLMIAGRLRWKPRASDATQRAAPAPRGRGRRRAARASRALRYAHRRERAQPERFLAGE